MSQAAEPEPTASSEPDTGPPPLSRAAYANLLDRIVTCAWAPGSILTEADAMKRTGIGKTPTREALQRLVGDGLLISLPRAGYRVAPITMRDIAELAEVRRIVDPEVALLAAASGLRPGPKMIELSRVSYSAGEASSIRDYIVANAGFHEAVADLTGNARLIRMARSLTRDVARLLYFSIPLNPRPEASRNEHADLLSAIATGDSARARELAAMEVEGFRAMVHDSLMQGSNLRDLSIERAGQR